MSKLKSMPEIIQSLIDCLEAEPPYVGDMSDIGNVIGYALGEHLRAEENVRDFHSGINHGISLKNGTH